VQDPIVKIPKIIYFFPFFLTRNGRFEHFFEKNDLRPLGVNFFQISSKQWQCQFFDPRIKFLM
jgi:hypothetical protein